MKPVLHDPEASLFCWRWFFYKVVLIAVNTNKDLIDPVLDWIAFNSISTLTCSLSEIHSSKCHLIVHYAVTITDK